MSEISEIRHEFQRMRRAYAQQDVIEITGDFTGGIGSYAASHERRRYELDISR